MLFEQKEVYRWKIFLSQGFEECVVSSEEVATQRVVRSQGKQQGV